MSSISWIQHIQPHSINIFLHVLFGSLGIVIASIQLFTHKGGAMHRRLGRLFLYCYLVVIVSATIGAIFFNFRIFLVVLTLTSSYSCFAGYRVLALRGSRPKTIDNVISTLGLICAVSFYIRMGTSEHVMPTITVIATLASLAMYCIYDLARNLVAELWLQRSWLIEHIVKMLSAVGALLSAASGNVLPQFGPVSQLMPTVIILVIASFFIYSTSRVHRHRV